MLSCNDVRGTHTSASLGTPASQVCTVVILANCLTLLFSAQLGVSPGAPQKTLEKGHTLRELGVWTTFWSCKCWSYFIRILYSILKGLDSIYQVLYAIYIYICIRILSAFQMNWTSDSSHDRMIVPPRNWAMEHLSFDVPQYFRVLDLPLGGNCWKEMNTCLLLPWIKKMESNYSWFKLIHETWLTWCSNHQKWWNIKHGEASVDWCLNIQNGAVGRWSLQNDH